MSNLALRAVGLCAKYSPEGDWAFDYALRLAGARFLKLNVFHFLVDPYDPTARVPENLTLEERSKLALRLERDLRMYYDDRLGDYLDAGFRLCEDPEGTELRHCLTKRQSQVLVLGYPGHEATFGGVAIADFVASLACPVVLVGPRSPIDIHLNGPAALIADELGLAEPDFTVLLAPRPAAAMAVIAGPPLPA